MRRLLTNAAAPLLLCLAAGLFALGKPGCTDRTIGPSLEQLVDVTRDVPGDGPRATPGDRVTVTYSAWLADGTRIEQLDLMSRGRTHSFFVGDGTVIAGIDHLVRGMRVGGEREAVIEPQAHWGHKGYGGVIPAETGVRFVIRLVGVERHVAPPRRPLSDPVADRLADERWR